MIDRRAIVPIIFGAFLVSVFLSALPRQEGTPYPLPEVPYFPTAKPTSNAPTVEGVALGRQLFYDPILSIDSTFSCASCHRQERAFSDGGIAKSVGVHGDRMLRNTPPLFNLAWYDRMFWDGSAKTIEDQAFFPVRAKSEMDLDWETAVARLEARPDYRDQFRALFGEGPIDSVRVCLALGQFQRTLISVNSKYDRVLRGEATFTEDEYAGFVLANDQSMGDCLHCHVTDAHALGTTGGFSNNGLDRAASSEAYTDLGFAKASGKSEDAGWFKIPSLRNVAVTAPYMHDGRFGSLEEVLAFYSAGVQHPFNVDTRLAAAQHGGLHLTKSEQCEIIAFLHTLTDSSFLTNPNFSNPFAAE